MKDRKCPVCHSNIEKRIIEREGFRIVKCQECSHVFINNPQEDTSSPFKGNIDIDEYKPRHKQILNLLDSYFQGKQDVKVAEIGSGVGHFAKLIIRVISMSILGT